MATFNNGESGLSVRNKLNTIINKVEGVSTIDNDINVDGVNLSPIASTIADTAVDIFVYDTRKDSDGGAWRKRTQHTSWYNETLNTSTRGSRKEFPAVAVIVLETSTITIYDGDDPSLPMWMVGNGTSSNDLFRIQDRATAVTALNGIISVAANNGYGLIVADYVNDTGRLWTQSAGSGYYKGNISQRESAEGWSLSASNGSIVNNTVNDVAMTVLPNAPIDAATGLPVPTIAVATDGGVSVIKDDETVVDDTTFSPINVVSFGIDNSVFYGRNGFGRVYKWDYSADTSSTATYVTNATNPPIAGNTNGGIVDFGDDEYWAVGGNTEGLNVFAENKLAANITSEFNTGWMNGDIKLATLSDTDATNVTGSELVTNGTFDTNTSGWSASGGATLSVVSNALRVENTGSANPVANQGITGLTVGATYVISAEIKTISAGAARVDFDHGGADGNGNVIAQTATPESGTHTFTATSSSATIQLYSLTAAGFSGEYAEFDNITLRLAEEDRSVNGNGLQVFGTVSKNPVATGADLVAYRFPSANDYLKQPTNSDLDSSSYTFMAWFKTGSNYENIFALRATDDTGPYVYLDIAPTVLKASINPTTGTTVLPASSNDVDTNTWQHAALVYKAGSICTLYLDGEVAATADVSDHTDTTFFDGVDDPALTVGVRMDGTSNRFNGDGLSLFRISTTTASPEQIKKIYEDEKVLFQDGAQATLYGSSDAVTALAYDDSTELLHVGTSAGRSVFQGLKRVDNTTTAVGAAISASNGLVADE